MGLTKEELFLHKEVLTKIKFDELTERWTLYLKDYEFLNLTRAQKQTLKRICQQNNIHLEELPTMMQIEETQKLLKEYQELKNKPKDNLSQIELEKIKERIEQIREKILIGHMRLVRNLINKSIKNIQESEDREDIYQIGYEELLKLIDIYDETKNATFLYYVCKYLIFRVKNQILVQLKGFGENIATDINRVITTRERIGLPIGTKDEQAILSEILGFKTKKMSVLLRIEKKLRTTINRSRK